MIVVNEPEPGEYVARVGDFAACAQYDGHGRPSPAPAACSRPRAPPTPGRTGRSKPTGWAFTNVGPAQASGLDHAADGGGGRGHPPRRRQPRRRPRATSRPASSPARPTGRGTAGRGSAARPARMTVPVFNNGGKAVASAAVTVRSGSTTGPVVAAGHRHRPRRLHAARPSTSRWTPRGRGRAHAGRHGDQRRQRADRQRRPGDRAVGRPRRRRACWSSTTTAPSTRTSPSPARWRRSASRTPIVTEHPDAATLKRYEAVVWEAGGDRAVGQLDAGDVDALTAYLDGGGKLLLTQQPRGERAGHPARPHQPGRQREGRGLRAELPGPRTGDVEPMTRSTPVTGSGLMAGTKHLLTVCPGRCTLDPMVAGEGGVRHRAGAVRLAGQRRGRGYGVAVTGDAEHARLQDRDARLQPVAAHHRRRDDRRPAPRRCDFFGVATGAPSVRTRRAGRLPLGRAPAGQRPAVDGPRGRARRSRRPAGDAVLPAPRPRRLPRAADAAGHRARVATPRTIPANAVTPDGVDYYLRAGSATTYDPPAARTAPSCTPSPSPSRR